MFTPGPARGAVLLLVFFAICLGLGYATLNRYDPRTTGATNDSARYDAMARGDSMVAPPFRFRVLVPTLVKAVRNVVPARVVGTWDPDMLATLIVTSAFTSATAVLLLHLGTRVSGGDSVVGLVASLLFMCSFTTVNYHLAGMVDSAEVFFLLCVIVAEHHRRYWAAVVLLPLAVLGKETTYLFGSTYFVAAWAWPLVRRQRLALSPLGWIVSGIVLGAGTILLVRHLVGGPTFADHQWGRMGVKQLLLNAIGVSTNRSLIYAFLFIGPLALPRLRRLPGVLLAGSAAMLWVAILTSAYGTIGNNVFRPVFDTVGPCLAIAAAMTLRDLVATRDAATQPGAPGRT